MPAQQSAAVNVAPAASSGSDPEASLARWQTAWAKTPGSSQASLGVVRALAALKRRRELLEFTIQLQTAHPDLADAALRLAGRLLPNDLPLGVAFCKLADPKTHPAEAAARWWQLRTRLPRRIAAHIGYINCMLGQRRIAEAERATLSALEFLKHEPPLLDAHARVASARGDWAEAARRWGVLAAAMPAHPAAAVRQAEAAQKAAEAPTAPPARPALRHFPPVAEMPPQQRAALRGRLMAFESIGRSCEFGLLQRMFGAEPLGLLRFATTRPDSLLKLLHTKFEGIGDPAHNEIVPVRKEYRLRHVPSQWRMHTHIRTDTADPATVLAEQCRHTGFLRGKLLNDLGRASKILVYFQPDLDDATIAELHTALQAYGPNVLMCVRLYGPSHPVGSVLWPQERLMVAHIDRQGREFKGAGWDISVDYWIHFCGVAIARRAALNPAAPRPGAIA